MDTIIPQDIPLKQCSRCDKFFPATPEFFFRDRSKKDGLHTLCKDCAKAGERMQNVPKSERKIFPDGYKKCKGCRKLLPATPDYFFVSKGRPDGLNPRCKECKSAYYYARRVLKRSVCPEGYKQCFTCKEFLPATTEHFHAYRSAKSGLQSNCKKCRSSYRSRHRQNNVEVYRARDRDYQASHKEQQKAANQRYTQRRRESHPPKQYIVDGKKQCPTCKKWKPATTEYFDRHKGRTNNLRSRCKECRIPERSEFARKYPERARASRHNRRRREQNAEGHYSNADIRKQLARQKGHCYYCRCRLKRYHIDHIVPLTRGGTNWPWNIVLACRTCNLRKGNKLLHEWAEGGRLL